MTANVSKPDVKGFYDEPSGSIGYVVSDPETKRAAIIDPVLDYDEKAARISTRTADAMLADAAARHLKIEWIFDTHPHADHLSAAAYLKEKTGAPTAIGERIIEVQAIWRGIYNESTFPTDGRQWDKLFADGAAFSIGTLPVRVMLTAGHTLASITYLIGDAAFINDTLFQPDTGSARCDFPGGNAETQYASIMSLLSLPDETRLFTGHDYCANGRKPTWESTVAEQKANNIQFKSKPNRDEYVRLRLARDKTLALPRLMLHALQFNLRGGRLPPPETDGRHYLKIPVNYF